MKVSWVVVVVVWSNYSSHLQVQTFWFSDRDWVLYDPGDFWSWPGQGLDRSLTINLLFIIIWILGKIDQTEFDGFEYVNPLLMSSEDVVWEDVKHFTIIQEDYVFSIYFCKSICNKHLFFYVQYFCSFIGKMINSSF